MAQRSQATDRAAIRNSRAFVQSGTNAAIVRRLAEHATARGNPPTRACIQRQRGPRFSRPHRCFDTTRLGAGSTATGSSMSGSDTARRPPPAAACALPPGTGSCLPSKVLSNKDLEKIMDTSDEWIVQRTGVRTRYVIDPTKGESTSTLSAEAVRRALAEPH